MASKEKQRPLFMVNENDDGDGWYLSDDARGYPHSRPAAEEDIRPETMAEMMDMACESENYHHLVGAHEALASILVDEVGFDAAKRIMRRLVNRGSLMNLGR